ncbi:conjugal transfer protein [Listeria monocytogenes]|uniref:conjugal transfer protein n=1 Tax=Listeria monocytogenes TaxID=1639 RepID=UPI0012442875|nr:conjugal transfer protein [Listeria monocytogenes]KAA9612725.1 conjugal transfer protein [Listeria monocytogenes]
MKKIKSYTSIWNVEKVIYAINDLQLPFPITFTQMTWFIVSLLVVVMFGSLPPLSLIDGVLLKYVGIPVGLTWFMSQKTFDGKKPYGFLKSILTYFIRSKTTYAGKAVKLQKQQFNEAITIVRSELYYGISN